MFVKSRRAGMCMAFVVAAGAMIAVLTLCAPVVGRTATVNPPYAEGSHQLEDGGATSAIAPLTWDSRALSKESGIVTSNLLESGKGSTSGGSRTLLHSRGCHRRGCVAPP